MPKQQSGHLRSLLDDFVHDRQYVPPEAQRIESLEELPLRLQTVAASYTQEEWNAWSLDQRIWFVVAQKVCLRPERPLEAALKVRFYDHDGVLVAAGIWSRPTGSRPTGSRSTGSWVLHSVLDEGFTVPGNDAIDRPEQLARVS